MKLERVKNFFLKTVMTKTFSKVRSLKDKKISQNTFFDKH